MAARGARVAMAAFPTEVMSGSGSAVMRLIRNSDPHSVADLTPALDEVEDEIRNPVR